MKLSKFQVLTNVLLSSAIVLFAGRATAALSCSEVFAPTRLELKILNPQLLDMIREYQIVASTGQLVHKTVASFSTYYVQQPSRATSVPGVFVDTKAIVIALGGAGTHTATGAAWKKMSHSLAKYDVAVMAFDYPFHGKGSRDQNTSELKNYIESLETFIRTYRKTGLPVYFVGHSFGPALMQELALRNPEVARGFIMLGPGADLSARHVVHYDDFMDRLFSPGYQGEMQMLLNKDVINHEGELWNRAIGRQMQSRDRDQKTLSPVRIYAGEKDEWSTPEILHEVARRFVDAQVQIIKGANHVSILELAGKSEFFVVEEILDIIRATSALQVNKAHSLALTSGGKIDYLTHESALFRLMLANLKQPLNSYRKNDLREDLLIKQFDEFVRNVIVGQSQAMAQAKPESVPPGISEILLRKSSDVTPNELQKLMSYLHSANTGGELE